MALMMKEGPPGALGFSAFGRECDFYQIHPSGVAGEDFNVQLSREDQILTDGGHTVSFMEE